MDDDVLIPGRGRVAVVDVSSLVQHKDMVEFEFEDRLGVPRDGFVMRWHDELVAFENRCPHWQVPLFDSEVLTDTATESYLVCPFHGAVFDPLTGECVNGPCVGDSLTRLVISLVGDFANLSLPGPRLF